MEEKLVPATVTTRTTKGRGQWRRGFCRGPVSSCTGEIHPQVMHADLLGLLAASSAADFVLVSKSWVSHKVIPLRSRLGAVLS